MAWPKDDNQSEGYRLIKNELDQAKRYLEDRTRDLEKARAHVKELEDICTSLTKRITLLERDQQALDRGYVSLMCENAHPDNR